MKKVLSLLLSLTVLLSVFSLAPLKSYAIEGESSEIENPAYSGETVSVPNVRLASNSWLSSTAPKLRDSMVERRASFAFTLPTERLDSDGLRDKVNQLIEYAVSQELSVSTVDGDYIRYQWARYNFGYSYDSGKGLYDINMRIEYRDTAYEEKQVDMIVNKYLGNIDMSSISDYELLKKFHDYILSICEYNFYDMNSEYNYSCYGVFSVGKAVCQGYSLAFYRLCKEAGFDVRIIISDNEEGNHAWNLVYIGDAYYYVDCTWDDEDSDKYRYFLVDYDTLRSDDTSSREHTVFDAEYKRDTNFQSIKNNISKVCWSTTSANLGNCTVILNGDSIDTVSVKSGGTALIKNTDYTVSTDATHFVVVNGAGAYTGSKTSRCKTVNVLTPKLQFTSTVFSGSEKRPTVSFAGLKQDKDYKVLYFDNRNAGTAQVMITGMGKYKGVIYTQFTITKQDINAFTVKASFTQTYYNGKAQEPTVTVKELEEGTDYKVEAKPITQPGTSTVTVSGINSCYGSKQLSFKVVKHKITEKDITLQKTDYVYNGNSRKPKVYISGLVEGEDFTVSYSSNKKPGIAKVVVKGNNYYEGEKTLKFKIHPREVSLKSASSKTSQIKLGWSESRYADGYEIRQYKSSKWVKVKTSSKTSAAVTGLKSGTQYKLRLYAYVKSGSKTVYSDPIEITTSTTGPKPTKISSLKAGKKSFTLKWKKKKCTGYEIEYSTESSFKKSKKLTVKSASTVSKKAGKLKKGKKYYVRVRTYNDMGSKKIYGTWSAKKSVTVK
jgi:hypothetical protein